MKKIITTICTLIILFTKVTAQDLQVVTLDKTGEMFSFYGNDAFRQAMDKADHGDIVTLSAGTFGAVSNISKAVKIYGQGYRNSATTGIKGITIINSIVTIAIDSTDNKPTEGLYIEGIKFNANVNVNRHLMEAEFTNCYFKEMDFRESSSNIIIHKCIFGTLRTKNQIDMSILNTGIRNLYPAFSSSLLFLLNCVVESCYTNQTDYTTWRNCIIGSCLLESGSHSYFSERSSFYNCVYEYYTYTDTDMLKYSNRVDKCSRISSSTSIKSLFDSMSPYYTLTTDAQSKYLGTDSTQVGIYGGDGFSITPSTPQVVYRNVASKTENDKLKVSLKVEIRPTDEE